MASLIPNICMSWRRAITSPLRGQCLSGSRRNHPDSILGRRIHGKANRYESRCYERIGNCRIRLPVRWWAALAIIARVPVIPILPIPRAPIESNCGLRRLRNSTSIVGTSAFVPRNSLQCYDWRP